MSTLDASIGTLDGRPTTLGKLMDGRAALVVNVASECDLTPQYTALETLHRTYAERGFTVIGVPCNQFDAQEPGSPEQIATFCSTTYDVTFPLTEKVNVNPPDQHAIYAALTAVPDEGGVAGDVEWNFEKYLVAADGTVVWRIRPDTEPDDPSVVAAIEGLLAR
jgi:glutathione peroxidase